MMKFHHELRTLFYTNSISARISCLLRAEQDVIEYVDHAILFGNIKEMEKELVSAHD